MFDIKAVRMKMEEKQTLKEETNNSNNNNNKNNNNLTHYKTLKKPNASIYQICYFSFQLIVRKGYLRLDQRCVYACACVCIQSKVVNVWLFQR
jgi:hypothetical protein